jgi:hypothetical protein
MAPTRSNSPFRRDGVTGEAASSRALKTSRACLLMAAPYSATGVGREAECLTIRERRTVVLTPARGGVDVAGTFDGVVRCVVAGRETTTPAAPALGATPDEVAELVGVESWLGDPLGVPTELDGGETGVAWGAGSGAGPGEEAPLEGAGSGWAPPLPA